MRSLKFLFLFLFVFLFLNIIPIVHAETDFNFLEFPERVGEALFGGNTFAGGLFCSFILMLIFLLPTLFLCKDQEGATTLVAAFLVSGMALSGCVAIGWLPLWTLIMMTLGVAALLSIKIGNVFGENA